jgi:hypothetical protein
MAFALHLRRVWPACSLTDVCMYGTECTNHNTMIRRAQLLATACVLYAHFSGSRSSWVIHVGDHCQKATCGCCTGGHTVSTTGHAVIHSLCDCMQLAFEFQLHCMRSPTCGSCDAAHSPNVITYDEEHVRRGRSVGSTQQCEPHEEHREPIVQ